MIRFIRNILFLLALIALFALGYLIQVMPNIPLTETIHIIPNEENLNRGEYLANHVSACISCHSERDWSKFSGPIRTNTEGIGGQVFDHHRGFKGVFIAKNITPFKMDFWTDEEIVRAITTGVEMDNKPIHPVMPYKAYRNLEKKDAFAIVAYIRSLENKISPEYISKADFPRNIILKTIPQKYQEPEPIDYSNPIARGEYLATIANCIDCHSQSKNGDYLTNMTLAGGKEFILPTGDKIYSANITPDKTTGIGEWSEAKFINKFKYYLSNPPKTITSNQKNTIMAWTAYANMSNSDLSAIYNYLMSSQPISNVVSNNSLPSEDD